MHGHRHPATRQASGVQSSRFSSWGLLVLLSLAQLMVILDISAVNVALPNLTKDLGIGQAGLSWTITSYSLMFGSLLLLGGRAADLIGRRRVFLTGLAVFTTASLGSALAGSAAALFAARAGQGLGAALLSPSALSIITSQFKGHERARALGVWGAVGGAGAAIGVLLGGLLTQLIDWRAIFFINLPIGLIVAAGAVHLIPADTTRADWRRLDLRGALLATASVAALVYAFSQAQRSGWASTQTVGLLIAGLAGLVTFVFAERRVSVPLLRVQRLADRAIGGGFLMMLAATAVLFGSFLLSSLYLQDVLAASPLATGLAFLPFALAIGAGVHAGTHLVSQRGVRAPLTGGFASRGHRTVPAHRSQRPRQLRQRPAARHADRRHRPRRHPRVRRVLGPLGRPARGDRHALRTEHHRSRGGRLNRARRAHHDRRRHARPRTRRRRDDRDHERHQQRVPRSRDNRRCGKHPGACDPADRKEVPAQTRTRSTREHPLIG